jgi:hypothetical protein
MPHVVENASGLETVSQPTNEIDLRSENKLEKRLNQPGA